jgi:hypothetical protein
MKIIICRIGIRILGCGCYLSKWKSIFLRPTITFTICCLTSLLHFFLRLVVLRNVCMQVPNNCQGRPSYRKRTSRQIKSHFFSTSLFNDSLGLRDCLVRLPFPFPTSLRSSAHDLRRNNFDTPRIHGYCARSNVLTLSYEDG